MLSERQLARGYSTLWSRWMPGLDAAFIRKVAALDGSLRHFAEQWATPMPRIAPGQPSDLICEVAFGLFAAAVSRGGAVADLGPQDELRIAQAARQRMDVLRYRGLPQSSFVAAGGVVPLDGAASLEARTLAHRLMERLDSLGQTLEVQPRVAGLGCLQACHPDVLCGQELIEVKMSQASFRSSDLRQAIVYAALLHAEGQRSIRALSLVNPRLGLTWRFTLEDLARETAGCSAAMLLRRIELWADEGVGAKAGGDAMGDGP